MFVPRLYQHVAHTVESRSALMFRAACVVSASILLSACLGGGGGGGGGGAGGGAGGGGGAFAVGGAAVANPPVVGATVTVFDASGNQVGNTTTAADGSYNVNIVGGTAPFRIQIRGGQIDTDADGFVDTPYGGTLLSAARSSSSTTAQASNLTTLAYKLALLLTQRSTPAATVPSSANLDTAASIVKERFGFGLDFDSFSTPPIAIATQVGNSTAQQRSLNHRYANDALVDIVANRLSQMVDGDVIDESSAAFDAFLDVLAADLTDGRLDGTIAAGVASPAKFADFNTSLGSGERFTANIAALQPTTRSFAGVVVQFTNEATRHAGFTPTLSTSTPEGFNLNVTPDGSTPAYDPTAKAVANRSRVLNREAVVPSQCYTKTEGVSNPCWTCHTVSQGVNFQDDFALQAEYSFSDVGLTNHWSNLFVDRRAAIASISDAEALDYIREDNYTALRIALGSDDTRVLWQPDLDFQRGFDADGLAKDGSWWRAFRYKPFLGTFWPTNGSTDDVLIRLPDAFHQTSDGRNSVEIYKINLAILEAAMSVHFDVPVANLTREVEPVSEDIAGIDLDGSGTIGGHVTRLRGLPSHYVGKASDQAVLRGIYPLHSAFLHTVRYVDPDAPTLLSTRMKEVRYMVKTTLHRVDRLVGFYEREAEEKDAGQLPQFGGSALDGLRNDFGWTLFGYIEDAEGRLRVQTEEETLFCMGCHSTIGVTADQTFGFPRKLPGAAGWGHQDIAGIKDVPQHGHSKPEILTYFERVGGGDEFRANSEVLSRFFNAGLVNEAEVRRAAPGGDLDIRHLIAPSRERALRLDKAYMALVREQNFERGRDTVLAPTQKVHENITNGSTDLGLSGKLFNDGTIYLDWRGQ